MVFLEKKFFKPDQNNHSQYEYDFIIEDHYLTSAGHKIHGQLVKHKGVQKGLIIQFHGNAKNISSHITHVDWLPEYGYDVFIFDYCGYGRSKGNITRKIATQNGIDILAFTNKVFSPKSCIILGQSLGASIACAALAKTKYHINGVIIDSAFPSFRKLVHHTIIQNTNKKLPSMLIPRLISGGFDIEQTIRHISSRILVLHGKQDDIVPFHFGEEIASICNGEFWPSDTGHAELFRDPSLQSGFKEKLLIWLENASGHSKP